MFLGIDIFSGIMIWFSGGLILYVFVGLLRWVIKTIAERRLIDK